MGSGPESQIEVTNLWRVYVVVVFSVVVAAAAIAAAGAAERRAECGPVSSLCHPTRRFVVREPLLEGRALWKLYGGEERRGYGEMTCTTVRDVTYGSGTSSLTGERRAGSAGCCGSSTKLNAGTRRVRVYLVCVRERESETVTQTCNRLKAHSSKCLRLFVSIVYVVCGWGEMCAVEMAGIGP